MSSIYLSNADRARAEAGDIFLQYLNTSIKFQFPPIFSADNRKISWDVIDANFGRDAIAFMTGNSARNMSVQLEYIVEDPSLENPDLEDNQPRVRLGFGFGVTSPWTIGRIKFITNALKGYFTGFREARGGTLIARFRYPLITGPKSHTIRINSVSVKYEGPTIAGGNSVFYPLKTIIDLDISTVSKDNDNESISYWDGLDEFPTFDELWY